MTDKNEQHEFDDLFKDQLGDFKVPPLRVSHRADHEEEEVDQLFRQQFNDFESAPQDHVWDSIQERLPLHLIWRRRLIRLSQAAAVLLFATLGSVLLTQGSSPFYDLVSQETTPAVAPTEVIETTPADTDYVYDVDQAQDDYDRHENSRSVFTEDPQLQQLRESQQRYLENNGDLSPLASSPIEALDNEVVDAEALSGEKAIENLKIPMKTPTAHRGASEVKVANNNSGRESEINPAQ
ncbi:MAG: hypothetical protein AAFW73_07695 [Bacteroidota bacterium]